MRLGRNTGDSAMSGFRVVLIVMLSFASLIVVAGQAVAQDATDPLADLTADIRDTSGDSGIPDIVTIAVAEDCTVDQEEATVAVEDPDGTRVTLANGDNVEITATDDGISITATGAGGDIEGGTPTGGDDPLTFDPGQGTVIESTGITCGAGGQDNDGQDDQDTDDENPSDGQGEGCDDPRELEAFSGTENQLTDEFRVTGRTFRVRADVEVTDPDAGFPVLEVDVLDDAGEPIGQGLLTFEEDASENILAGPGSFSLDIRAGDLEYAIEVDDCVGTADDGNGDGNDDDGDTNDDGVIDDTVPDKDLPNTGGFPLIVAGGVVLVSAFAIFAAWRSRER